MRNFFRNRFVVFFIYLSLLLLIEFVFTGSLFPSTDTRDLWFYSGIFMILFSILFIEPYYTSPKNVITNAIPLFLVLLSTKQDFENSTLWLVAIISVSTILLISILPLMLENPQKSLASRQNRIAHYLKGIAVIVGRGKVLYSAAFLLFLMMNIFSRNGGEFSQVFDLHFLFLMFAWGLILSIDPRGISNTFSAQRKRVSKAAVGEIIGVQSKKIFLARLFDDRKFVRRFDVVKFKYSMQDSDDIEITGIIFDTYFLNQERWVKVLQLGQIKKSETNLQKNTVYLIDKKDKRSKLEEDLKVNRFVGVVTQGTDIGRLRFEYSKQTNDLQEGDLLELQFSNKRLFYQVINGQTRIENLEARNEVDFIEGEAIQLGEWDADRLSFQKFGWLPSVNTPIFVADTSDITIEEIKKPLFEIGKVPGTTLPSILNLDLVGSHHMAILGVTGSGKSFLARKIINELRNNTKIICVDFTGEWRKELPANDVESFDTNEDAIETEKISLIELNDVSNTTESLKETNDRLQEIFSYAKENAGSKICLVLEEAHTIVPETTFLGDYGDYSANKALVNKMSQIALQGRKYGIGLLVLAQRTANVSKTVLTQCNTVICFQAFDDTSYTFLKNYIGNDLAKALANLKQFHAVVVGKAAKSNLPMIIDMEEKPDEDT